MAQDTNIENLIINKLTKAQYESIANPDPTQLYFITDEVISSEDVTNALGYTPYNATNPEGYTSNVGTVTSVNNIQPDTNGNVSLTIPDTATWGNITETYVNGNSWYRVYSDGWCEQGGTGSTAAQASNSVALLKAYTNTNYTLLATNNFEETGGNVTIQAVKTSNSEFNINAKEYNVNTYYARSYCWYACGYIN